MGKQQIARKGIIMSVRKAKKKPIKGPKLEELQKKLDKVKGNIQISRRNTWFSDALTNLDKKEQ
jgi:hypothetical protein